MNVSESSRVEDREIFRILNFLIYLSILKMTEKIDFDEFVLKAALTNKERMKRKKKNRNNEQDQEKSV